MKNIRIRSVCLTFVGFFCLLIPTSLGDRQCKDKVSPDDEATADVLNTFLETLLDYSGMNPDNPKMVTVNCPTTECSVNPNGTAIWDARKELYKNYMMDSLNMEDETELKKTLDGCLCYSETVEDYNSCMEEVRTRMVVGLDDILIKEFITKVNADECALYETNCIQSNS